MPKKSATKRKKAPAIVKAQAAQSFSPAPVGPPPRNPSESRLVVGLVLAVLLISVANHFWKRSQAAVVSGPGAASGGPWIKMQSEGKFRISTSAYALKADSQGNLYVLTPTGITGYHPTPAAGEAFASVTLNVKPGWRNMAFDGKRFYVTVGDNTIRIVPKDLSQVSAKIRVHGAKDLFGIAVSGDGHIYVTDRKLHCVFILTRQGEVVGKVGGPHGEDNFVYPVDVVFDKAGNFYTSDFLNSSIKRFGPDGKQAATWTAPWSNHDWERVCVLGQRVYIDGANDHMIFIEDLSGGNIGDCVELEDGTHMDSPQMVGAGLDGFLYVLESDTGMVYKLKAL
jgi:hypothetical protein